MSTPKVKFEQAITQLGIEGALQQAQSFAASLGYTWTHGATVVFQASCKPGLEPNFRGTQQSSNESIEKWVRQYFNDYHNRPSVRKSNPPATVHDDALDIVIHSRLKGLASSELDLIKWAHRLGMSAENIMGTILEEYLADRLMAHGWYCAWGSVVKAVDFVSEAGDLLQVKSRNNTENSSSNKIRNGTNIKKWWRFHATQGSTNWDELNQLLGLNVLSEMDFRAFVTDLVHKNPEAMAVEPANTWKSISESKQPSY